MIYKKNYSHLEVNPVQHTLSTYIAKWVVFSNGRFPLPTEPIAGSSSDRYKHFSQQLITPAFEEPHTMCGCGSTLWGEMRWHTPTEVLLCSNATVVVCHLTSQGVQMQHIPPWLPHLDQRVKHSRHEGQLSPIKGDDCSTAPASIVTEQVHGEIREFLLLP